MDIGSLMTVEDHNDGAEYNVLSPRDGKKTDVFIKIKGPDSVEWRKQKRLQTNAIIASRGAKDAKTEIDYDAMDIDALVAVTVSWRGIVKDGKEWPCTKANARKLYEQSPRIVSQLLTFVSDTVNFTNG